MLFWHPFIWDQMVPVEATNRRCQPLFRMHVVQAHHLLGQKSSGERARRNAQPLAETIDSHLHSG